MSRRQLTEPVDLDTCLRAFTQEEELGEDEKWHCSGCKEQVLATKKLDIWRLPPILVSHFLIIIMVIFKCYVPREHIALSYEKNGVNIELGKTNRLKALRMMKNHT